MPAYQSSSRWREGRMMELTLICRLITLALLSLGMFGCTGSDQDGSSKTSVHSESASYSSQERQSELKAALAAAKVEYQVEMRSGQEFVTWGARDSAIAKAALESPLGPELPAGRHMSFSNELRAEFEDWLKANGVSYFTKSRDGQEYVVWSEQDNSRVRDWLRKRLPEAVYVTMFDRPAPGTSAGK
jgi:hypothetical protein